MATISLSDSAPKVDGAYGFSLANASFDLKAGDKYDTEDPIVISAALVNPWLDVEFPEAPAPDADAYDPNDPHDNPAADHLSPLATPEVKVAADEADAAIQNAAFPNNPAADDTAVADEKVDSTAKTTPTVTVATPPASTASSATAAPTTTGVSS